MKGMILLATDKSLANSNTSMLILKLLDGEDMYGYQMIDTLAKRSDDTFALKAGTLYPLLKSLLDDGFITCYEENADNARVRKYYHLTKSGKGHLTEKIDAWQKYSGSIENVLKGGNNGLCKTLIKIPL